MAIKVTDVYCMYTDRYIETRFELSEETGYTMQHEATYKSVRDLSKQMRPELKMGLEFLVGELDAVA